MISKIGHRLIYDKETGIILNGFLGERSSSGSDLSIYRKMDAFFIDLPYGYNENKFREAIDYHIDITKDIKTTELKDLIIIDKYIEREESEEEKLRREKEGLENQLLLKENKELGGIL